jgi:glutamine amidotransferase
MIGVISYRTGNAQSVLYALRRLGLAGRLVERPEQAHDADRLILPGVGSAGVTMASLAEQGWPEYLRERVVGDATPFLGVCVGLQVLFDHSEEEDATCLGFLPGRVVRFDAASVRVPQIGWNEVRRSGAHPFTAELPDPGHFYFVNSYHAVPDRSSDVAAVASYGVEFTAAVGHGPIMATQFHVEKSGPLGLSLLHRFATLNVSTLEGALC